MRRANAGCNAWVKGAVTARNTGRCDAHLHDARHRSAVQCNAIRKCTTILLLIVKAILWWFSELQIIIALFGTGCLSLAGSFQICGHRNLHAPNLN